MRGRIHNLRGRWLERFESLGNVDFVLMRSMLKQTMLEMSREQEGKRERQYIVEIKKYRSRIDGQTRR